MNELAIRLKLLKQYAHMAHNLVKGEAFFQDHEFLGDIYEKIDGHYDNVIERMIGLDMEPNIAQINLEAAKRLQVTGGKVADCHEALGTVMGRLNSICELIEQECRNKSLSQGTLQLLGGMADEYEVLKYKIKQRLKESY